MDELVSIVIAFHNKYVMVYIIHIMTADVLLFHNVMLPLSANVMAALQILYTK